MNAHSPETRLESDHTNNQVDLFNGVIYQVPEMNPSNWQKMIKLMILNIQIRTNLMNEVTHLRAENLKLNSKLVKSQGLLTKFQKELESTNKRVNREESVKQEMRKDGQNQNSNTKADTNELKRLSENSSQFNAEMFNQHAEEVLRNYHETELNTKQQTNSLNNLVNANANANVSLGSKRKRERKAAFEGIKRVRVEKPDERIRPLLD